MCIDKRRYMVTNLSTPYGQLELGIEQVYVDSDYGKCRCPVRTRQDMLREETITVESVNTAVYDPNTDSMIYPNGQGITQVRKTVKKKSNGYTNTRGDRITYLTSKKKK